jgi:hypothetical protein
MALAAHIQASQQAVVAQVTVSLRRRRGDQQAFKAHIIPVRSWGGEAAGRPGAKTGTAL